MYQFDNYNNIKEIHEMKQRTTANLTTELSLTRPFHHDRGCFVFAVSPRRGEQADRVGRGNFTPSPSRNRA